MDKFKERSTRTYRQKQMLSKAELEARENVCIYDEPAFCTAACPLKLDGRAFAGKMQAGDFTGARTMLERITPFPLILAGGCESPCSAACRLSEVGEGIDISALERAAVKFGAPKGGRGMFRIKKSKRAAILGADLFSLALAGELAGKSYPVTYYAEEPNAAALMDRCAPFLDEEARAAETDRLCGLDIELRFGSSLDAALFERVKAESDILCMSEEVRKALIPETPDPDTLVCMEAGIVAGTPQVAAGTLAALYGAKRAALSVDRLAQGMYPASCRGAEGPVTSRLFTNLSEVAPTKKVPEGEDGYTPQEAKEEAGRCIQCRCEECFKGCAYLAHYGKSPRALTREIYNNVSIIMGDHMMNKPINSCALCEQCSVTCPYGYDMADICHMARENMVATGKMPLAPHEFALYDMLFSNGEAFLVRPQKKGEPSKYVFFPGCQTAAISPATVAAAYKDLADRLPGGVALMLGCCGVIADWAGRYELFGETTEFLKNELAKLGDPMIIAGCPTCKKTLEKSLDRKVLNIYEVLADLGVTPPKSKDRQVVLHDACGARGDLAMRAAVEKLAGEAGLTVSKAPYSDDRTPCCGYGGLVMYANREVAHEMAEKCTELEGPYVTYCMNCKDRFAREGHESAHILELVYGIPPGSPPDISGKRKNRLKLKKELLRECWGERMEEEMIDFPLEITKEARALMDDRMILDSDVIQVMKAYRKSGEAVQDCETGLLTTRTRIGNVTFWVVFEERDGGYLVRKAYSHRMTVS